MIPGETALWGYPAVVVLKDAYGEFEVLDGIQSADLTRAAVRVEEGGELS